jgi:hypothetical protein
VTSRTARVCLHGHVDMIGPASVRHHDASIMKRALRATLAKGVRRVQKATYDGGFGSSTALWRRLPYGPACQCH